MNGEFRQYRGPRDADALISFVEDQSWKDIEPVTSWKHPDSIQMAIVSYFFKLSHYLKEVNNVMLVDYGMPPWLTYVLFAIVTILLGALLGLILVSIIDLIFPPVSQNTRKSFAQENAAAATDEDAQDVIEDDGESATPSGAVPANDDEEDEDAPSTSEGEKFSGSDSDESSANEDDAERKPILSLFFFFYLNFQLKSNEFFCCFQMKRLLLVIVMWKSRQSHRPRFENANREKPIECAHTAAATQAPIFINQTTKNNSELHII